MQKKPQEAPFHWRDVKQHVRAVFLLPLIFTILLGLIYPLFTLSVSQIIFNRQAQGSLLVKDGKVIGSELLGQSFTSPKYFWGRLSATTPAYNAASSTGSNYSPGNPRLLEAVNARIAALQKADPKNKAPIPVDLVTASASGLDPHISVAAAEYQLARVARVRGVNEVAVRALMSQYTTSWFGNRYVNVLQLNLALDGR